EALAPARRPRVAEDQVDVPLPVRRQRTPGEEDEAGRPGGQHARQLTGKLEKAALPVLSRQRPPAGRIEPVRPRPLPPTRRPLPGRRTSGQHRLSLTVLGGLIVAVLLILLLLLPRVFGFALFPAGFPVLGSSSAARISLTVKSANVHDTFLLTASPQVTQPNASTRVMPDRNAQSSANGKRTVATSGLHNSGGTRANGTLHFDNSGFRQVTVSGGFTFISNNNVQVRLTTSIVVPGRSEGQDGSFDAPAEA